MARASGPSRDSVSPGEPLVTVARIIAASRSSSKALTVLDIHAVNHHLSRNITFDTFKAFVP
jgi:hypothetical protein